jgi:hypothetical protein
LGSPFSHALVIVLAITFLILPSVSVKIFSTFACENFDDGTSYLKVDYSLSCQTETYKLHSLYAAGMVLVYPIGIPFSYWLLLYRKRKLLNCRQLRKEESMSEEQALKAALEEREENELRDPTLKALGFLYEQYEPKFYWFEVFETLRKLALTGFLVFMVPGTASQILLSLIINLASMRVYSGKKPYIESFYDRFSEVAQWQLFFTLLGALAMKVNLDGQNLESKAYFDMILTGMQFVPTVLVSLFYLTRTRKIKMSDIEDLIRTSKSSRAALDFGDLEVEEDGIELNEKVAQVNNKRASTFSKFKENKNIGKGRASLNLANREGRSLSKEAVGLGGEVISKHQKIQRIAEKLEQEEDTTEAELDVEQNKEQNTEHNKEQNWEKIFDEATGFFYYQHKISGMSTWEMPKDFKGSED